MPCKSAFPVPVAALSRTQLPSIGLTSSRIACSVGGTARDRFECDFVYPLTLSCGKPAAITETESDERQDLSADSSRQLAIAAWSIR